MTSIHVALHGTGLSDRMHVRRAWKRLSLKYHPDKMAGAAHGAASDAEPTFEQISDAFKMIQTHWRHEVVTSFLSVLSVLGGLRSRAGA